MAKLRMSKETQAADGVPPDAATAIPLHLALPDLPGGQDKSLKRVSDVLAPLDHGQKLQLYKMIRDGYLEDMAEPVAQMLVTMLNGRRSEHARRVWTGLFDALILRDDSLLSSGVRLAGALHLADVSAWWFALAPRMEPQVSRVQETVARLAKDQPLNEIFASAEAQSWADELRQRSLAVLARLRATPAEATAFLSEVSGFRAQMLKRHGVRQREGVSRADLERMETILLAAPAWAGQPLPSLLHGDPVRLAREMVRRGDCTRDGAAMFAVAGLHRRDDAALATRLFEAFPVAVAKDAIIGRLLVAAETLRATLTGSFLSKPGLLVADAVDDRDHPSAQLQHFLAWYDAVHALELDTTDRERNMVHQAFRELSNAVHEDLAPVLARRIEALTMHSVLDPLIERVRFVNEFQAQLARRGIVSSGKPWRAEDGNHVATVFRRLSSTGAAEGLRTLGQLADLADMLSYPIEITALDIALASVIEAALRQQQTFGAAETRLIDRVIAVSSDERKRCRWWVAPEVVTLLDAAEKSGIAGTAKK
ncbi:hypothetical protein [Azospirillum brasilense]|uniref:Uncharacterized protein n=1 Tax=Azospirillum brasilense TaxID=192 RepID=A0A235H9Q4_AZOBR|nr:hypothetical protein [Azospirillum brasilense]OYD82560.1 hypothetical protein CHT98_20415 [Azospirillum brasilense]